MTRFLEGALIAPVFLWCAGLVAGFFEIIVVESIDTGLRNSIEAVCRIAEAFLILLFR